MKLRARAVRWHQFTRRHDAVFRSLHREIVIGTLSVATLLSAVPRTAKAQTAAPAEADTARSAVTLDEVEVAAARVPMPMGQTSRIVGVVTRQQIEDCPAQSVNDLLKYTASIDVRQRGAFGIQTDISILGGTHDGILILLDGVNISSPHTGHLAADLPISKDDIERIEVLEGAASRVYGTSAFAGAINIVTRKSASSSSSSSSSSTTSHPLSGYLSAEGGSYGTWGANGALTLQSKQTVHSLSGGGQHSDGGTPNSDFDRWRGYYRGDTRLDDISLHWQLGMSGMNYGANTFYSGRYPNQYEEGRRYMASVSATTNGRVVFEPTLYWNHALDHFQLIRHSSTGENFHMTDVYGASLNAHTDWTAGTTSFGAEIRNEGIHSTNLGRPLAEKDYVDIPGHEGQYTHRDNRTNICYFLEHDLLLRQWTFSAGIMANMNTGLDHRFRLYPGIDVSYRPSAAWHLFASWNMAQRMPTFTELYYKSPTQEGNTGLKPEEVSEFAVGAAWRPSPAWSFRLRAFHRHQTSMIDWVMTPADSVNGYTTYHATSFRLDNMGVSASATLALHALWGDQQPLRTLSAQYTYLHQNRHDDVEVYASSYALDYLRHKLVLRLDAEPLPRLLATLTYRWQQRMGSYVQYKPVQAADGTVSYAASTVAYRPYGLLSLRLQYTLSSVQLYAEADNLTAHRYYDLGNVRQPGLWLMGGVKYTF